MFEVIKDLTGWAVVDKRKNDIERGFWSKKDAEEYVKRKEKELYKGSGVLGNEI